MGVKKIVFVENDTNERAGKVLKNKRISLLDKYIQIKKLYTDYFCYQLNNDVKTSLYENHYEKIMKDGVIQATNYYKIYDEEIKNLAFNNVFVLCEQFDELVKQGLDVKLLKSSHENFAIDLIKLKKECGFNKNFDSDEYYSNKQIRDKVSTKVNQFVEKCQQQHQSEIEYDM